MNKGSFGDKISIKSLEKKENWGKSLLINDLFVSVPVYLPQVARKIKPPVMTGSVSSPVATEAKIYKLLSSPQGIITKEYQKRSKNSVSA